ncbi:cytidylyltransferase family-domain-containing protein [Umbelopsis sp. PMI_123]|nr:cytidylyltransferase family-domain-containing protein [Umbelopsis sp. PMI_123]
MPLKRRSAKKNDVAVHSNHKAATVEQEKEDEKATVLLAAEPSNKKWKNWWIRTITTLIMIGSFFFILASGHVWVIVMVEAIQTLVYREIIQIAQVPAKARNVRWFKTMSWYFLISTNYFLYGESIMHYFKQIVMVDAFLLPFATHHRFISFVLYVIGFVFFVANLKKGQYKFQFSQFCWTHMALLLVVVQSHFIVNNILEGMIWFVLPTSLVICNDIFAYICGFFWGKTQLIQLSPKKTVEGFVGAWICTLIFGFLWTILLMQFDYMICPVKDLGVSAWSNVTCEPKNPVFTSVPWQLPPMWITLAKVLLRQDIQQVWIAPVQLHALVMACFASLIAPFGGFFASGVKRAFNIKDFGDSIPGHGGMTDRMDCQFLMGVFSSIYYQSFIKTYNMSVGTVLATTINSLTIPEQLELIERLQTYLVNQAVLDAKAVARCGVESLIRKN